MHLIKCGFIFGFLIFTDVVAQELPSKNILTFEAGGVAQIVSANYERIFFYQKKYFVCGRIGLGIGPFLYPGIPHGVTFNFGRSKKFLEVGILGSLGPTTFGYADYSSVYYFLAPMIGYRRHAARGVVFKVYFSTFITAEKYPEVIPFAGIGFGFALKRKSRTPKVTP